MTTSRRARHGRGTSCSSSLRHRDRQHIVLSTGVHIVPLSREPGFDIRRIDVNCMVRFHAAAGWLTVKVWPNKVSISKEAAYISRLVCHPEKEEETPTPVFVFLIHVHHLLQEHQATRIYIKSTSTIRIIDDDLNELIYLETLSQMDRRRRG